MSSNRFDDQASAWDEAPHRVVLARDVAEAISSYLPLSKSMDVLDYGCGTGLLSLALRPSVGEITCADTSQGMLDVLARKVRYGGAGTLTPRRLMPGEALDLGLRFHLIVSSMTLHHIQALEPLAKSFLAHLHPGGWVALADLAKEDGSFHEDAEGVFHHGFTAESLTALLKGAGFQEVQVVKATTIRRGKKDYPVLLALGRARM